MPRIFKPGAPSAGASNGVPFGGDSVLRSLPYIVQYAKTGRAVCVACSRKIKLRALRCREATQKNQWYHPRCFRVSRTDPTSDDQQDFSSLSFAPSNFRGIAALEKVDRERFAVEVSFALDQLRGSSASVDDIAAASLSQSSAGGSSQLGFGLDALLAASRDKHAPNSRPSGGNLRHLSAKPLASSAGRIGSKADKRDLLEFPLSASSLSKSPLPGSSLRSAYDHTHSNSSPVSTAGDSSVITAPLSSQSSSFSSHYTQKSNSQEVSTPGRSLKVNTPDGASHASGVEVASPEQVSSSGSMPGGSVQCSSGSSPLPPPPPVSSAITRGDSLEFLQSPQRSAPKSLSRPTFGSGSRSRSRSHSRSSLDQVPITASSLGAAGAIGTSPSDRQRKASHDSNLGRQPQPQPHPQVPASPVEMSPCVKADAIRPRARLFSTEGGTYIATSTVQELGKRSHLLSSHHSPLNLAQKRLRAQRRIDKPDLVPTTFRTDLLFGRAKGSSSSKPTPLDDPSSILGSNRDSSSSDTRDASQLSSGLNPSSSVDMKKKPASDSHSGSTSTPAKARRRGGSSLIARSLMDDEVRDGRSAKRSPFDDLFLGDSEDEDNGVLGGEAFDFDFHRTAKDDDDASDGEQGSDAALSRHKEERGSMKRGGNKPQRGRGSRGGRGKRRGARRGRRRGRRRLSGGLREIRQKRHADDFKPDIELKSPANLRRSTRVRNGPSSTSLFNDGLVSWDLVEFNPSQSDDAVIISPPPEKAAEVGDSAAVASQQAEEAAEVGTDDTIASLPIEEIAEAGNDAVVASPPPAEKATEVVIDAVVAPPPTEKAAEVGADTTITPPQATRATEGFADSAADDASASSQGPQRAKEAHGADTDGTNAIVMAAGKSQTRHACSRLMENAGGTHASEDGNAPAPPLEESDDTSASTVRLESMAFSDTEVSALSEDSDWDGDSPRASVTLQDSANLQSSTCSNGVPGATESPLDNDASIHAGAESGVKIIDDHEASRSNPADLLPSRAGEPEPGCGSSSTSSQSSSAFGYVSSQMHDSSPMVDSTQSQVLSPANSKPADGASSTPTNVNDFYALPSSSSTHFPGSDGVASADSSEQSDEMLDEDMSDLRTDDPADFDASASNSSPNPTSDLDSHSDAHVGPRSVAGTRVEAHPAVATCVEAHPAVAARVEARPAVATRVESDSVAGGRVLHDSDNANALNASGVDSAAGIDNSMCVVGQSFLDSGEPSRVPPLAAHVSHAEESGEVSTSLDNEHGSSTSSIACSSLSHATTPLSTESAVLPVADENDNNAMSDITSYSADVDTDALPNTQALSTSSQLSSGGDSGVKTVFDSTSASSDVVVDAEALPDARALSTSSALSAADESNSSNTMSDGLSPSDDANKDALPDEQALSTSSRLSSADESDSTTVFDSAAVSAPIDIDGDVDALPSAQALTASPSSSSHSTPPSVEADVVVGVEALPSAQALSTSPSSSSDSTPPSVDVDVVVGVEAVANEQALSTSSSASPRDNRAQEEVAPADAVSALPISANVRPRRADGDDASSLQMEINENPESAALTAAAGQCDQSTSATVQVCEKSATASPARNAVGNSITDGAASPRGVRTTSPALCDVKLSVNSSVLSSGSHSDEFSAHQGSDAVVLPSSFSLRSSNATGRSSSSDSRPDGDALTHKPRNRSPSRSLAIHGARVHLSTVNKRTREVIVIDDDDDDDEPVFVSSSSSNRNGGSSSSSNRCSSSKRSSSNRNDSTYGSQSSGVARQLTPLNPSRSSGNTPIQTSLTPTAAPKPQKALTATDLSTVSSSSARSCGKRPLPVDIDTGCHQRSVSSRTALRSSPKRTVEEETIGEPAAASVSSSTASDCDRSRSGTRAPRSSQSTSSTSSPSLRVGDVDSIQNRSLTRGESDPGDNSTQPSISSPLRATAKASARKHRHRGRSRLLQLRIDADSDNSSSSSSQHSTKSSSSRQSDQSSSISSSSLLDDESSSPIDLQIDADLDADGVVGGRRVSRPLSPLSQLASPSAGRQIDGIVPFPPPESSSLSDLRRSRLPSDLDFSLSGSTSTSLSHTNAVSTSGSSGSTRGSSLTSIPTEPNSNAVSSSGGGDSSAQSSLPMSTPGETNSNAVSSITSSSGSTRGSSLTSAPVEPNSNAVSASNNGDITSRSSSLSDYPVGPLNAISSSSNGDSSSRSSSSDSSSVESNSNAISSRRDGDSSNGSLSPTASPVEPNSNAIPSINHGDSSNGSLSPAASPVEVNPNAVSSRSDGDSSSRSSSLMSTHVEANSTSSRNSSSSSSSGSTRTSSPMYPSAVSNSNPIATISKNSSSNSSSLASLSVDSSADFSPPSNSFALSVDGENGGDAAMEIDEDDTSEQIVQVAPSTVSPPSVEPPIERSLSPLSQLVVSTPDNSPPFDEASSMPTAQASASAATSTSAPAPTTAAVTSTSIEGESSAKFQTATSAAALNFESPAGTQTTATVSTQSPSTAADISAQTPNIAAEVSIQSPSATTTVSTQSPTTVGAVSTQSPTTVGAVSSQSPNTAGAVSMQSSTTVGAVSLQLPNTAGTVSSQSSAPVTVVSTQSPNTAGAVSSQFPTTVGAVCSQFPNAVGAVSSQSRTTVGDVHSQSPNTFGAVSLQSSTAVAGVSSQSSTTVAGVSSQSPTASGAVSTQSLTIATDVSTHAATSTAATVSSQSPSSSSVQSPTNSSAQPQNQTRAPKPKPKRRTKPRTPARADLRRSSRTATRRASQISAHKREFIEATKVARLRRPKRKKPSAAADGNSDAKGAADADRFVPNKKRSSPASPPPPPASPTPKPPNSQRRRSVRLSINSKRRAPGGSRSDSSSSSSSTSSRTSSKSKSKSKSSRSPSRRQRRRRLCVDLTR